MSSSQEDSANLLRLVVEDVRSAFAFKSELPDQLQDVLACKHESVRSDCRLRSRMGFIVLFPELFTLGPANFLSVSDFDAFFLPVSRSLHFSLCQIDDRDLFGQFVLIDDAEFDSDATRAFASVDLLFHNCLELVVLTILSLSPTGESNSRLLQHHSFELVGLVFV